MSTSLAPPDSDSYGLRPSKSTPLSLSSPPSPDIGVDHLATWPDKPCDLVTHCPGKELMELLPSAGPRFPKVERPMNDFLKEVRNSVFLPAATGTQIRGFCNPGNLCYRNAVVVALLHSRRFVAFLMAHENRIKASPRRSHMEQHLLTYLCDLARAYWTPSSSPAGGGASAGGNDINKMMFRLWRACQSESIESTTGTSRNWLTVCREQQSPPISPVGGALAGVGAPFWLNSQQQDAVEFFDWFMGVALTQLRGSEEANQRNELTRATNYAADMFDVRLTVRWVCGECQQAIRLRRPGAVRQVGLQANVMSPPHGRRTKVTKVSEASKVGSIGNTTRLHDLSEYLNDSFDGDAIGGCVECPRCQGRPDPLRRLIRMQTAPEVLPVHLLRVGYNVARQATVKHHTVVDVPEFLDVSDWLEPHVFAAGTRVVYRLNTVISHCGRDARTGHYVTHVRCRDGNVDTSSNPMIALNAAMARRAQQDHQIKQATAAYQAQLAIIQASTTPDDGGFAEYGRIRKRRHAAALHTYAEAVRVAEASLDSRGWARVDDTQVTMNVAFREVTNATHDPEAMSGWQADDKDWYDPVLLVYEKWMQQCVYDPETGTRLYQMPMNVPKGEVDLDGSAPVEVVGLASGTVVGAARGMYLHRKISKRSRQKDATATQLQKAPSKRSREETEMEGHLATKKRRP